MYFWETIKGWNEREKELLDRRTDVFRVFNEYRKQFPEATQAELENALKGAGGSYWMGLPRDETMANIVRENEERKAKREEDESLAAMRSRFTARGEMMPHITAAINAAGPKESREEIQKRIVRDIYGEGYAGTIPPMLNNLLTDRLITTTRNDFRNKLIRQMADDAQNDASVWTQAQSNPQLIADRYGVPLETVKAMGARFKTREDERLRVIELNEREQSAKIGERWAKAGLTGDAVLQAIRNEMGPEWVERNMLHLKPWMELADKRVKDEERTLTEGSHTKMKEAFNSINTGESMKDLVAVLMGGDAEGWDKAQNRVEIMISRAIDNALGGMTEEDYARIKSTRDALVKKWKEQILDTAKTMANAADNTYDSTIRENRREAARTVRQSLASGPKSFDSRNAGYLADVGVKLGDNVVSDTLRETIRKAHSGLAEDGKLPFSDVQGRAYGQELERAIVQSISNNIAFPNQEAAMKFYQNVAQIQFTPDDFVGADSNQKLINRIQNSSIFKTYADAYSQDKVSDIMERAAMGGAGYTNTSSQKFYADVKSQLIEGIDGDEARYNIITTGDGAVQALEGTNLLVALRLLKSNMAAARTAFGLQMDHRKELVDWGGRDSFLPIGEKWNEDAFNDATVYSQMREDQLVRKIDGKISALEASIADDEAAAANSPQGGGVNLDRLFAWEDRRITTPLQRGVQNPAQTMLGIEVGGRTARRDIGVVPAQGGLTSAQLTSNQHGIIHAVNNSVMAYLESLKANGGPFEPQAYTNAIQRALDGLNSGHKSMIEAVLADREKASGKLTVDDLQTLKLIPDLEQMKLVIPNFNPRMVWNAFPFGVYARRYDDHPPR